MEVCTIGEKVYCDTFGGMVKGVVTRIIPLTLIPGLSGQTSAYDLEIKVTSKNNLCYTSGEIISLNSLHVIPRRFYHKTGIFRFVVYPDYVWR